MGEKLVTGNDLQLRSRKNRKLLTPLRFGCFGRNVKNKNHLPVSGNYPLDGRAINFALISVIVA